MQDGSEPDLAEQPWTARRQTKQRTGGKSAGTRLASQREKKKGTGVVSAGWCPGFCPVKYSAAHAQASWVDCTTVTYARAAEYSAVVDHSCGLYNKQIVS